MTFVHGHPRDSGWVKSHFRRPRRPGEEQLDLGAGRGADDAGGHADVPTPRDPPDGATDDDDVSGGAGRS